MGFLNQQRHAWKPIGNRNVSVTLQVPTNVTDSMGGRTQTWSTYGHEYASVTPQPFVVSEQEASVLYVIECPFRDDVALGHRVLTDDLTLKVIAIVDPELRHRAVVLHCAEVVLTA